MDVFVSVDEVEHRPGCIDAQGDHSVGEKPVTT